MKKGQITLFVIIGIIIIAVIGLGVYFRGSIIQDKATESLAERDVVEPEVQEVYNHIFDCAEETAKEGLVLIGLQGGYAQAPLDSIDIEDEGISIAIGYDQGENKLPTLLTIQNELVSYVNTFAPTCVNLNLFEGFSFEEKDPSTSVRILEDAVVFEINYPVVAKKGDTTYNLDKSYKFSYPVRFRRIYEISQSIINNEKDAVSIDINYLLDFGIDIDVLSYDEGQVIYLLTDDESKLDEIPYVFMFGNRYSQWNEQ